ncbi:MAG: hypothetical protein ACOZJX_12505 [Pseudomonadota bacterium]
MHPSTAVVPPRPTPRRGTLPRAAWIAGGVMAITLVVLGYTLASRMRPEPGPTTAAEPQPALAPARAQAPHRAINSPQPAPGRKPPPARASEPPVQRNQPPSGRKPPPVQGEGRARQVAVSV